MKCPICGSELLVGTKYDGEGKEHGVISHHCQVVADTRGKALEEYERRVSELLGSKGR